ncbi:MAG: hypothetical protein PHC62_00550 [Candidatus Izemoplasmatales bacterium]|nr:hypothetical protein [Candidatus Izemoplasmatales bacterium]
MANSRLYWITSDNTKYPSIIMNGTNETTIANNLANVKLSTTPYTSAIVPNDYYAYTDGYTFGNGVSNQGTSKGYQIMVVVKCKTPSKENRKVRITCAVYFRRTDGVASNNALTLKLKSTRSKAEKNYSQNFVTSNKWQRTVYHEWDLTYYNLTGVYTDIITVTGKNNTNTCSSINCQLEVQVPDIGPKPVATTMTLETPNLTIGQQQRFNLTRSTGTKCDIALYYTKDDGTETSILATQDYLGTSLPWTPPLSILNDVTKTSVISCYYAIATFISKADGTKGELLGRYTYKGTIKVPKDDPNIGFKLTSISVDDSSGRGQAATDPIEVVPGYELGKSKPFMQVRVNASKRYGATVTTIKYSISTRTKTFTYTPTAQPSDQAEYNHNFTATIAVNSIGPNVVRVELADSRGITVMKEVVINVREATMPPVIDGMSVTRGIGTTADGFVANDEGLNIRLWFKAYSSAMELDNFEGDSMTSKIQWKKVNETSYPAENVLPFPPSSVNAHWQENLILTGLDETHAYTIRVEVNDGTAVYREMIVSASGYFVEFGASGKGLSIGQSADTDQEDFRVNLPTKFNKPVLNSSGTNQFTSDERKKNNIVPLINQLSNQSLYDFYETIEPIAYEYRDDDRKVPLTHFGFSANKIKDKLESLGMNVENLSIIQTYEEIIKDPSNPNERVIEHFLSLGYEELNPINFLAIKLILKELNSIKNKLKEIENG